MGNAIEHSDERIRVDSYYSFYLEGESNVNYKNRKEEGEWNGYRETGEIEAIGNYKNGKLEGGWKGYHKNGKLAAIGNYKNGI